MKNVKGGYKIISLEENDLTASFSVKGIYNALSKTYDKTILVSGIVIDGEKKNDAYTEVNVDSTDYKFTVYGYEVTVSSDDSVEASEIASVTSIGGVTGDITLGTGLSITEDGELSASASEVKWYVHYYRNAQSSNIYYIISTVDKLATNFTEFAKVLAKSSSYMLFEGIGNTRIGLGIQFTAIPDMSQLMYLTVADNTTIKVISVSTFTTNSSNTITEI